MGCYKQSPALIVIVAALLLWTPLAYAQLLQPVRLPPVPTVPAVPTVGTGLFSGVLCCTPTGTCAPGSPRLPNVTVNLNCTNLLTNTQTLLQGLTNVTGVFNINVPIVGGVLGSLPLDGLLSCNIFVNLPLNSTVCPILNGVTGILTGVPTLVNTIIGGVLGPVLVFVLQALRIVTISTT